MAYQFISPGAAAGSGILEVLAQRRAEERQRLLDEVAAKDSEARRKMYDQQMAEAQQRMEQSSVNMAEEGMEIGDEPPPGMEDLFRKHGRTRPSRVKETPVQGSAAVYMGFKPGEEISGISGPTEAGQTVKPEFVKGGYVGTADQRERARKSAAAAELGKKLADPNLSQEQKVALIIQAEAEGIPVDSGTYTAVMKKPQPRVIVDADGKEIARFPGDTDVTVLPREPRQPKEPTGTWSYIGTEPDTGHILQQHSVTGEVRVVPRPIGPKPSAASGNKSSRIPPAMLNDLNNRRKAAAPPTFGSPPQAAIDALRQAENNIIYAFPTTQDVRDTIRDLLNNEDEAETNINIVKTAQLEQWFSTPEEYNDFAELLALIRGNQ